MKIFQTILQLIDILTAHEHIDCRSALSEGAGSLIILSDDDRVLAARCQILDAHIHAVFLFGVRWKITQEHLVRLIQRMREIVEEIRDPRIAVRLEDGDDPAVRTADPRCLDQ